MPRVASDHEWEDDDFGDSEDWEPDEDEFRADHDPDELPTIPCAYCGKEMIEESIRCPHCGEYQSQEDAPPESKPNWIVFGLILAFLAVFFWLAK